VASGDLPAIVGQSVPGDRIQLQVWRNGKDVNVQAQLANATDKVAEAPAKQGNAAEGGKLGLALRPLQPDEKRESGIASGLVVEDVSGAAARAGVEPGDVILAVNGTPAKSVEQVRSVVAKADKSVALLIQRGEDKIFVPVRIG
jgi:serine protease Do